MFLFIFKFRYLYIYIYIFFCIYIYLFKYVHMYIWLVNDSPQYVYLRFAGIYTTAYHIYIRSTMVGTRGCHKPGPSLRMVQMALVVMVQMALGLPH